MTKIGLIGGSMSYVVNRTREQGYRDALRKAQTALDETLIFENCDENDKVEQAVKKLTEEKAECIVCMDDAICSSVLQILAENDISVPDQMQIASFYEQ